MLAFNLILINQPVEIIKIFTPTHCNQLLRQWLGILWLVCCCKERTSQAKKTFSAGIDAICAIVTCPQLGRAGRPNAEARVTQGQCLMHGGHFVE